VRGNEAAVAEGADEGVEILRAEFSSGGEAGGQSGGGRWLRCGLLHIGQWEGDFADALKEGAKVSAGGEVGDAVVSFADEAVEDLINSEGEFAGVEPLEVLTEGAPAGEGGVEAVLRDGRRAGDGGFGRVVVAEQLVASGGAAAVAAVGQDEGAFGSHGLFLL
jgi:hypothetical protein